MQISLAMFFYLGQLYSTIRKYFVCPEIIWFADPCLDWYN